MFAKHNAEITGIAKVSQNEVFGARWIAEVVMMGGRENINRKCSNEKGSKS